MFCDRMDVQKSQRVPPFSFFGIVRLFSEFFFTLQFVDVLQQWMLKDTKGSLTWRTSSVVWVFREFEIFEFFDTFVSFCYF